MLLFWIVLHEIKLFVKYFEFLYIYKLFKSYANFVTQNFSFLLLHNFKIIRKNTNNLSMKQFHFMQFYNLMYFS